MNTHYHAHNSKKRVIRPLRHLKSAHLIFPHVHDMGHLLRWGIAAVASLATFFVISTIPTMPSSIAVSPEITTLITKAFESTYQVAAVSNFDSNLLLHYPFDDSVATDASGKGNTGIFHGAPSLSSGKVGSGAFSFDGVDDAIKAGEVSRNLTQFTASAWVKFGRDGTTEYFFGKFNDATGGWTLLRDPAGKVSFWVFNTSFAMATADSPANIATGEWHHLAGVYDGTRVLLYIDGQSVDSTPGTLSGTVDTNGPVCVGAYAPSRVECTGTPTKALIDDVRMYDIALSPVQIGELVALGGTIPPPQETLPPTTPVNGMCSSTVNICSQGTSEEVNDTSTHYLWSCVGQSGGTTASCSLPISTEPTTETTSTNFRTTDTLSAELKNIKAYAGTGQAFTVEIKDTGNAPMNIIFPATTNRGNKLSVLGPSNALSNGVVSVIYTTPLSSGTDSFSYTVSNGSVSVTGDVQFIIQNPTAQTWAPPIGIPRPEFGIDETYRMYDNPAYRNTSLTYTQNTEGGYYTHYINDLGACSDWNGNVPNQGTLSSPRCTIPALLPEGSVVEVRHTMSYSQTITALGTQARPVFVRGATQSNKAAIVGPSAYPTNSSLYLNASKYSILENLDIGGIGFDSSNFVALRNSDIHGYYSTSVQGTSGTNYVFLNNKIHDNHPNWDADVVEGSDDPDRGGFKAGGYIRNLWVLDSEVYHVSGCGICFGDYVNDSARHEQLQNVYVGRNDLHDLRQSGAGQKQGKNFVYSQNKFHAIKFDTFHRGPGITMQYYASNVWVLFNHFYDLRTGVEIQGLAGNNQYLIGNLIHDIHETPEMVFSPLGESGSAGLIVRGGNNVKIVGNTIYNTDTGIRALPPNHEISNNLVSTISRTDGNYLVLPQTTSVAGIKNNLFFHSGIGTPKINISGVAYGPQDVNSISSDPQFVAPSTNNLSLSANSSAANSGISSTVYTDFFNQFGIDIRKDFLGNNRPAGSTWDIGAFEYGATGGNVPLPTVTPVPTIPPVIADISPSITSVTASSITTTSAVISWTTDKNATTRIEYGLTTSFGSLTPLVSTLSLAHAQTLSNLTPNKLYYYRVISTDAQGNTNTSGNGTFSTLSSESQQNPAVNTPPQNTPGRSRSHSSNTITTTPTTTTTPAPCTPTGTTFLRSLTLGSVGADVKALQQFLNQKGYKVAVTGPGSPGLETTYFGPATKAAVIRFQAATGIVPASGLFGPLTRAKVATLQGTTVPGCATTMTPITTITPVVTTTANTTFTRTLTLGSTGADVRVLQQFLNQKGYKVAATGPGSPGNETATFGPATRAAVIRFQTANNIVPQSGVVGPVTRVRINLLQ
jgi:peptidoglycan hydrolase-like protein with peptidoglycan-binding domain